MESKLFEQLLYLFRGMSCFFLSTEIKSQKVCLLCVCVCVWVCAHLYSYIFPNHLTVAVVIVSTYSKVLHSTRPNLQLDTSMNFCLLGNQIIMFIRMLPKVKAIWLCVKPTGLLEMECRLLGWGASVPLALEAQMLFLLTF